MLTLKICVTVFSRTIPATTLKLGIHMSNKVLYSLCVNKFSHELAGIFKLYINMKDE